MRVAVFGAGAIGSFYGARLAWAARTWCWWAAGPTSRPCAATA